MDSGALKALDFALYRRGQLITALARWLSVGLALLSLAFVWDDPAHPPLGRPGDRRGLLGLNAGRSLWSAGQRRATPLKLVHDLVDALAVGLGAAFTGGMASPIWLLLYPHVVAVSRARRGLAYALAFGALDAGIVTALAALDPRTRWARCTPSPCSSARSWPAPPAPTCSRSRTAWPAQPRAEGHQRPARGRPGRPHEIQREQDQALARLSESEDRYRRLLERIQDGVLIVQDGRSSTRTRCSAPWSASAGGPGGAATSATWSRRRTGASCPSATGAGSRARPCPAPWRRACARGSGDDPAGEPARRLGWSSRGGAAVIATVRDITRERRMEQELKAHAERLAAINEIANAVNLSLTIEDILAVVADEARRLVPFDRLTIALLDDEEPEARPVRLAVGVGSQRLAFPRARGRLGLPSSPSPGARAIPRPARRARAAAAGRGGRAPRC